MALWWSELVEVCVFAWRRNAFLLCRDMRCYRTWICGLVGRRLRIGTCRSAYDSCLWYGLWGSTTCGTDRFDCRFGSKGWLIERFLGVLGMVNFAGASMTPRFVTFSLSRLGTCTIYVVVNVF